jgi:hypothetical protein
VKHHGDVHFAGLYAVPRVHVEEPGNADEFRIQSCRGASVVCGIEHDPVGGVVR